MVAVSAPGGDETEDLVLAGGQAGHGRPVPFAAGQGHSDSGNHNARTALVKHHYHASGWPLSHPRFNHPIYGEVERCNWDAECVAKWDADTAAFNRLPLAEQTIKLAVKKEKDDLDAAEALRAAEEAKNAVPAEGSQQAGSPAVEKATDQIN